MNYRLFIFPVSVLLFISCSNEEGKEATNLREQNVKQAEESLSRLQPKEVLKRYYKAINQGHFKTAYKLWASEGKASGQSFTEFKDSYENTEKAAITFTDSVNIGAAAGSIFATVPVRIEAVTEPGKQQVFTGKYILRKRNVGPDRPSYAWHIYSAELQLLDE